MTGESTDSVIVKTGRLPPAAVVALGESVLGRALKRRQGDADGLGPSIPIAAFQDSM